MLQVIDADDDYDLHDDHHADNAATHDLDHNDFFDDDIHDAAGSTTNVHFDSTETGCPPGIWCSWDDL